MREKARRRAEEDAKNRAGRYSYLKLPDGVEVYKPDEFNEYNKADRFTARQSIVPYVVSVNNHPDQDKGQLWYRRRFGVHKHTAIDGVVTLYVCPRVTSNKPCPDCKAQAELKQTKKWDDPEVKALNVQLRDLYNIKDGADPDGIIRVYDTAVGGTKHPSFGKLLDTEELNQDPEKWFGYQTERSDLETRYFKDSFNSREYAKPERIDFVPGEDLSDEDIENATDLDKVLDILPYDKLERILMDMEEEDADDEQPEKEGRRGRYEKELEPEKNKEEGDPPFDDDDPDPGKNKEEDVPDPPSPPKRTRTRTRKPKEEDNPCKFGHEFGVDCEKFDHCLDDCAQEDWEKCKDRQEELQPDDDIPF